MTPVQTLRSTVPIVWARAAARRLVSPVARSTDGVRSRTFASEPLVAECSILLANRLMTRRLSRLRMKAPMTISRIWSGLSVIQSANFATPTFSGAVDEEPAHVARVRAARFTSERRRGVVQEEMHGWPPYRAGPTGPGRAPACHVPRHRGHATERGVRPRKVRVAEVTLATPTAWRS